MVPDTHSLGSRLGLPGFQFHSAHHQTCKLRGITLFGPRHAFPRLAPRAFWISVSRSAPSNLQAEGNHVIRSPTRIPSARASGFLDFGFTQRNIKKGKLKEVTFLIHKMFFVGSWSGLPGFRFHAALHPKANARDLTVVLPQLAFRALRKGLFPGACETAPSNCALADCLRSVRTARRSSASLIAVTRFATTRHRPLPAGRRRWR